MLLKILAILVVIAVGAMLYIRLAPSDPAAWNSDPLGPGKGQVVPPGKAYPMMPEALIDRLNTIAIATPRTTLLVRDGTRATWITRSRLMGFPDYTTAQAYPADGGATLALHARQRFGQKDFGVNAARLTDWLARLSQPDH